MIRVFVGTSEGTDDLPAEKALKYSLEKNCSEDIELIFMRNLEDGFMGKFDCAGWATPFTNLRWAVPEYCNFEGRAIYMDVDQLNLRDISELYNIDMEGKPFASRDNRLCVMVFDNARMKDLLAPVSEIKTR
jgi:lipopolysaccharide biosynthesis glycosyltransferase